ncbi:hypothetical protein ASPZODRAFT_130782 [Penicilliopsis zonata CBS 506.65]|uniref:Uncharacterized protein n=1 Tax=Penicilliopsis zonata CBS 506.65 TaxID=1073090 RepID=A0A1L9SNP2_9EURO|nr:hypothetical protein ASPZODRAFT_130782 [Penicilliopsis zonata CBS 506.65]OJJ48674.1 hypothetical protein ASPZODRAFT_130782 [Penicilliopsis zonata CBS 506.65]
MSEAATLAVELGEDLEPLVSQAAAMLASKLPSLFNRRDTSSSSDEMLDSFLSKIIALPAATPTVPFSSSNGPPNGPPPFVHPDGPLPTPIRPSGSVMDLAPSGCAF